MKRKILSLFCIILVATLLVSCSAIKSTSNMMYANGGSSTSADLFREEMSMSSGGAGSNSYYSDSENAKAYDMAPQVAAAPSASDGSYTVNTVSGVTVGTQIDIPLAEKIIYSSNSSIETVHFDDAVKALDEMITQYSAFAESSYISGGDYTAKYYGYNAYRTANYVIRVPRESFKAFTESLATLGHVVSTSSNAVNVTEQYTDVEAQLKTYRTEESRLLAMLEKCDTVADMITIESTLSNVRYQIESLTSRLKNLDNQVNYSSVTINIREVEELTPETQTHRTYGQQLSDGIKKTLENIGDFFKDLFKFVVVNSPVLIILAVIIIVIIIICRRYTKRSKKAVKNIEPSNDSEHKQN